MVTLQELKDFARIDHDDDDALVTSLGTAAKEYVETATGKTFADPMPERAKLAIKALTVHWYDHREPVVVGQVSQVPAHIKSLIHQLRDWQDPETVVTP